MGNWTSRQRSFIAILAIKYGVEKIRAEEVNAKGAEIRLPKWYFNTCMYIMPVLVVVNGWLLAASDKGMVPGYMAESIYHSG